MSKRSPPRTPEGKGGIIIAANGQTRQLNTEIQGTKVSNYDLKDGKSEYTLHEKRNDFARSKVVEGPKRGVVLGNSKYSPHTEL